MSENTQQQQSDPRIITPMPADLVTAIDEFRWRQRLPSRSEAVRELIRRGLGSRGAGSPSST